MKLLRYRTTEAEHWRYDPLTRTVVAHFAGGSIEIPVCTQRHPRVSAFFINRRGEDEWQISPARCVDNGKGFTARPASYGHRGRHCDFLLLTGAPSQVNELMAELYES